MKQRRVSVGGEHLRAAIRPGSGKPLLILGELGANLELLEPFVSRLDDCEIILLDPPGIGRSGIRQPLRRMGGYARLTRDLLDALGYAGAVDVLGIAWGGLLAQRLARDYGDRVRRLVLVATSPGQTMFPGQFKSLMALSTPARFASARRYANAAEDTYGGLAQRDPELIRANAEAAIQPSAMGYWSQLLAVAGFSSLAWLHRLRQPTLILAGDDDPVVPLVNARLLNLLMPRSRLHVVKGAGHLLLVTRPDECSRVVQNFLLRDDVRQELPTKETL